MTNQILDDDFTPITLENLRFKGKLYGKKLKYDQRVEYLQKMRILLFLIPLLFIIPVILVFISQGNIIDVSILIETLIFTGIFLLAGAMFNKNPLVVLTLIALILLLLSISTFALIPVAALILILIGIGIYFNAKSLEKELIAAYKSGNEDAYLNA
jgi:peptidoglycan/LPS O-acetylase OafA/YrhL